MYCGKSLIAQRLCKHRKPESECTAPYVCDYAENADGLNITELNRKRKWRQANGFSI